MNQKTIALSILYAAFFASCTKGVKEPNATPSVSTASPGSVISDQASSGNFVPNEVLVRFKNGITENGRGRALGRISAAINEHVITQAMKHSGDNEGFYVVHTPMAVLEAISSLKSQPEVEYAEPNFIYTHESTSDDTYFTNGSLWGMYGASTSPANQYGSNAAAAWANGHTGSADVYVGIIDEGAMYNHADLAGNFGNPNEIYGNNNDDDGNGYKDDTYGWDFVSNDNTTFDGSADDHGTHVSGTIGGKGGNGFGVAGINWSVKMISAKFLGRNGGTTSNAIKAVDYITNLKATDGLNIVATNNSWGGGGFSQELQGAIERANTAGILFIAAAGNGGSDGIGDNNDAVANYPSNYPNDNIIAVAAITKTGDKSSFSNYGATKVDIGAPGSGIYSTVPTKSGGSGYSSYSGTSMATPHVTGAVASYVAAKGLTPKTKSDALVIKKAILSAAYPTSSLSGKCVTGGRLDVDAAIRGIINNSSQQ